MVVIDLSHADTSLQQEGPAVQPSLIRGDQTVEHLLTHRTLWQQLGDDELRVGELEPLDATRLFEANEADTASLRHHLANYGFTVV